jgi:hypothetical protein
MAWVKTGLWALMAWVGLQPWLFSQSDRPYFSLDFQRQNDYTFSTLQDVWYRVESGRYQLDLRAGHSNIYNTSLPSDRMVQFYVRTSIWQQFQWKPKLALVSWLETDQYFNNRNEKVNFYGGVRYQPLDFLTLTPMLGYSFDVRTAVLGGTDANPRVDQGLSTAVMISSAKVWSAEKLSTGTDVFFRHKFIDPRRQTNLILRHRWDKKFDEGVQLHAELEGGTHELDDYQGNSVKRILTDSIQPRLNFIYTLAKGLEWQSNNQFLLFRRRFLFEGLPGFQASDNDLTFSGMELETTQKLGWVGPRFRTSISYGYQFGSRVYDLANTTGLGETEYENRLLAEKQKDFLRNLHRIEWNTEWSPTRKHGFSAKIMSNYLQYDTQSETNYDDRDELSYLGGLDWSGRWNRRLLTKVGLSGNYRHYAFLFKQKSQENYVQRSLRMDFDFVWSPVSNWRLEGQNAVYVTYNVKDFSDFNKTDRSTRNLENQLKVNYRPSRKWEIEASFRRKETHQSYLNWEAFSETTLDTVSFATLEQKQRFYWSWNSFSCFAEAGYRHFQQGRKQKATVSGTDNQSFPATVRQITDQTGPILNFGVRGKNQATLDLGCWLQIQVRRNEFRRLEGQDFYPNIFLQTDLDKTVWAVRPYFTVRTNFYL